MRHTSLALGLAVGLLGVTAASSSASAQVFGVSGRVEVGVRTPPPRPRRVIAPRVRAGHIWVNGRYVRRHNRWVWIPGHTIRARAGYRYVQGRWIYRNGRYVWRAGRWNRFARPRYIPGHYAYRRGRRVWIYGHYSNQRPRFVSARHYRRHQRNNRRFRRDRIERRGYDSRGERRRHRRR